MKKKVGIKEVANALGVSVALVSYVLNGKEKEARVSNATAQLIKETANKLNYKPNHIAKSLKSGSSQTIGVILADISNPFFANLARIIEDVAKHNNFTVLFGSSDENTNKSASIMDLFNNRQVDGLIIAPVAGSQSQIMALKEQNLPFVLIDRYFPEIETNYVVTDNYNAAYNATNHLISTGHKKIALVIYESDLIHMQDRKRGYKDALIDKDIELISDMIIQVDHASLGLNFEKHLLRLLKNKKDIDAIFFATNTLAMHGLKVLNKVGYIVPKDIAVVSFDESDAFDFFYCPLTYVHQPIKKMGTSATQLLIDQIISNKVNKIFSKKIVNCDLIIRQSSK